MRKFSENRFLADLYRKDAVQAVFMQELIDRIDNVARQSGVALAGDLAAPPPVNAINVKASGEMLHVTLTHAAEVTRAIEYHIEVDTNPNFTAPHLVAQSTSRSHFFVLPLLLANADDLGGADAKLPAARAALITSAKRDCSGLLGWGHGYDCGICDEWRRHTHDVEQSANLGF